MRLAWRDQIPVWIAVGSGGPGGSDCCGGRVNGRGAVVVAASIVPFSRLVPEVNSRVRYVTPVSHSLIAVVANLPRLPPPAEHRLLRAVCGLPPRLQRLLFGRPKELDGQVLASDIQALIKLSEWVGDRSFTEQVTPAEARAATRVTSASATGPPLPMERVENLELPGPAGPVPARFYVPLGAAPSPRPLLVYFHGGGWVIGDLDTHDGLCRFLSANANVAVLSVDYRLAPECPFPGAVEDALAAFTWAGAEAQALGIDSSRIAVGGDSAGGNLAAAISLLARDSGGPQPAMQLLIYPVTNAAGKQASRDLFATGFMLTQADMDWFDHHYLPKGTDLADPRISMLGAENLADLPPAYVTTAGFDPLRDEGEAYAERMREAGVRVALRRHPGLVHSFANMTAFSPTARAAMLEVAGALRMGLATPAREAATQDAPTPAIS
jgi:acetyl esterase